MLRTRVFDLMEQRGQKQRWLLAELDRRGYRVSEGYLSQVKAGTKQPSRQFIEAVCAVFGMSEHALFYEEGNVMPAKTQKSSKPSAAARNGDGREPGKINVAIIGVGNCASSLVQGRYFYQDARQGDLIPGLMHVDLGGYHIRDVEVVAAFDVVKGKVGVDLAEAMWAHPNDTIMRSSGVLKPGWSSPLRAHVPRAAQRQ